MLANWLALRSVVRAVTLEGCVTFATSCVLVIASASQVLACTSRGSSEERELIEPEIAVVPDLVPPVQQEIPTLVDGYLSLKRLPTPAFRALVELVEHRERSKSRLYDTAIRELALVACEQQSPVVRSVIFATEIDQIFPIDKVREAQAVGCGFAVVGGKRYRGALFDNQCFAARLTATDKGLPLPKCGSPNTVGELVGERKRDRASSDRPVDVTVGSAVAVESTIPAATATVAEDKKNPADLGSAAVDKPMGLPNPSASGGFAPPVANPSGTTAKDVPSAGSQSAVPPVVDQNGSGG